MVVPQKCIIIVFTIIFSVCLERSMISGRRIKKKLRGPHSINQKGTLSNLEFTEPGFSLTDAEIKKFKIWSNGVIPYYIDEYSFDKTLRDKIRLFLDSVNSNTGLKFLELPSPVDDEKTRWLFFVNRNGLLECDDNVYNKMTNEGLQTIFLGYDCLTSGKALAALVLGIVGVPPQHNAPNRDKFIEVNLDNILPEKVKFFEKLKNTDWLFHDVEYDFASASHSDFFEHTKNGGATITTVGPIEESMLEGDSFSFGDIWKIRMLYNYILRKRKDKDHAPNCNKIFQPGKYFESYKPESDQEIKPRSKPKAYRGEKKGKDEKLSDTDSTDGENKKLSDSDGGSDENKENLTENDDSSDENNEKLTENESNGGNNEKLSENESNNDKSEGMKSKENLTENDDSSDENNEQLTENESNDGNNEKLSENESNDDKSEGMKSNKNLTENDSEDNQNAPQSDDPSLKSEKRTPLKNGKSRNKFTLDYTEELDDFTGEIEQLRGVKGKDFLASMSDEASD